MKVYELKCSNCGADLKVSADRKIIFCEYCGTKNLIDDEIIRSEVNHSGTVIYRDEAKLRELELKEAERIRKENKRKAAYRRWYIVLLVEAVLFFGMGFASMITLGNREVEEVFDGTAKFALVCCVVPFFYPYSYSERDKVLNYVICFFLSLFVFAACFLSGLSLGAFITGKSLA